MFPGSARSPFLREVALLFLAELEDEKASALILKRKIADTLRRMEICRGEEMVCQRVAIAEKRACFFSVG